MQRRIVWLSTMGALAGVVLALAVAVVAAPMWVRAIGAVSAGAIAVLEHGWLWARWRRAELELLTSRDAARDRRRRGEDPRIALLAGEDFQCGELVVVNDRGFVIRPERFQGWGARPKPLPPPAHPTWVTGFVGDESELEVDLDA